MMTPGQRAIRHERNVKLIFFFASILLLFLVLTQIQNMLVSFLFSFVTYYLLTPTVDFFERRGLSRLQSTLVPFISLALALLVLGLIFAPDLMNQMQSLQTNFPRYLKALADLIAQVETQVTGFVGNFAPFDIKTKVEAHIAGLSASFFQQVPDYLSRSFTIVFLAPFLSFFMLLNGRDFMRSLVGMMPNNLFELGLNLNYQIGSQVGGFIRARLLESLIVGFLLWFGLEVLHFPYAIVLAFFAATLNIIPYLGPVVGVVPPLIICMANAGGNSQILAILILYAIVQVIDTTILVPFLVAKIVDLHPVSVVLAILVGSQLLGILGMIICIPVAAALKVTFAALYRHFTGFRT